MSLTGFYCWMFSLCVALAEQFSTWGGIPAATDGGKVGSDRCVGDAAEGEEFFTECLGAIRTQNPGAMNDECLVAVEPNLLIADIVQLAVDDDGADDQADGDNELKCHKGAAERATFHPCGHFAFEHFDGLEGGQVEGGIAAGEEAYE